MTESHEIDFGGKRLPRGLKRKAFRTKSDFLTKEDFAAGTMGTV